VEIVQDIDLTRNSNTELYSTFEIESKDLSRRGYFTTDTNGFGQRKRALKDSLPLQGNVYPISTGLFVDDSSKRVTYVDFVVIHGIDGLSLFFGVLGLDF